MTVTREQIAKIKASINPDSPTILQVLSPVAYDIIQYIEQLESELKQQRENTKVVVESTQAIERENTRYRKALEWYADDANSTRYDEYFVPGVEEYSDPDVLRDRGRRAQKALKGV